MVIGFGVRRLIDMPLEIYYCFALHVVYQLLFLNSFANYYGIMKLKFSILQMTKLNIAAPLCISRCLYIYYTSPWVACEYIQRTRRAC